MNKSLLNPNIDDIKSPKGRLFMCRIAFELEGLTDKQRLFTLKHLICDECSHEDLIKEFNADEKFLEGISVAVGKLRKMYEEVEDYLGSDF